MGATLTASERQVEEQKDLLLSLRATVEKQSSALQELRATVEEQSSALQELRATVEEQSSALQELRATVEEQSSALQELRATVEELSSALQELRATVEELKRENRERPKVAFSASLSKTKYCSTDITLVYKHVFTNIGNAYSPVTGIFTAPVCGIYYFRFTAFGFTSKNRRVSLYKGGQLMVTVTDCRTPHNGENSGSNGVTLQLKEDEEVYTRLKAEHQVYDDEAHHTTFTGFLIST